MTLIHELERGRRARAAIEELIATPSLLGPDFQPIRRLSDESLIGYKATGRGQPGTEVGDTLSLLQGAQSVGLVERLDWTFRCLAFDVAQAAGIDVPLHLTPEPETFGSMCPPRLALSFARGQRQLDVYAELHEDAFQDLHRLRRAVDEMREWGWRFVVTDLSMGNAAAGELDWIRPAYVQVDLSIPGRAAQAGIRTWTSRARDLGAEVMALGVDSGDQRDAARGLGATCGRGSILGLPVDLGH